MALTVGASNEAEALLNRFNLGRARSLQVLQSWLPESRKDAESSKEHEQADDRVFTPSFELIGTGTSASMESEEGSLMQVQHMRDQQLRRQLLGKRGSKIERETLHRPQNVSVRPVFKDTSTRLKRIRPEESSDEEGGRASAFQSTRCRAPKSLDEYRDHSIYANSAAKNTPASCIPSRSKGSNSGEEGKSLGHESAAVRSQQTVLEHNVAQQSSASPEIAKVDEVSPQRAERKRKRKKKRKNGERQPTITSR